MAREIYSIPTGYRVFSSDSEAGSDDEECEEVTNVDVTEDNDTNMTVDSTSESAYEGDISNHATNTLLLLDNKQRR